MARSWLELLLVTQLFSTCTTIFGRAEMSVTYFAFIVRNNLLLSATIASHEIILPTVTWRCQTCVITAMTLQKHKMRLVTEIPGQALTARKKTLVTMMRKNHQQKWLLRVTVEREFLSVHHSSESKLILTNK
ncbi:hypothetical protein EJB05_30542, partial [Eragrostis curvula]